MEGLASLMEQGQAVQAERALGTLGLLLQKPGLCAAACRSSIPDMVRPVKSSSAQNARSAEARLGGVINTPVNHMLRYSKGMLMLCMH